MYTLACDIWREPVIVYQPYLILCFEKYIVSIKMHTDVNLLNDVQLAGLLKSYYRHTGYRFLLRYILKFIYRINQKVIKRETNLMGFFL